MKEELIHQHQEGFEGILGYGNYWRCASVLDEAMTSCRVVGSEARDQFARVRKMVESPHEAEASPHEL